jgi:hypothetical protein
MPDELMYSSNTLASFSVSRANRSWGFGIISARDFMLSRSPPQTVYERTGSGRKLTTSLMFLSLQCPNAVVPGGMSARGEWVLLGQCIHMRQQCVVNLIAVNGTGHAQAD